MKIVSVSGLKRRDEEFINKINNTDRTSEVIVPELNIDLLQPIDFRKLHKFVIGDQLPPINAASGYSNSMLVGDRSRTAMNIQRDKKGNDSRTADFSISDIMKQRRNINVNNNVYQVRSGTVHAKRVPLGLRCAKPPKVESIWCRRQRKAENFEDLMLRPPLVRYRKAPLMMNQMGTIEKYYKVA